MSQANDATPGAITELTDYPTTDDRVGITNPTDPPETQPQPGDSAKLVADGGAITHIPGHIRGRMLSASDLLDFGRKGWDMRPHGRAPEKTKGADDPDAAFGTGTKERPDRWTRDDALQVRQLVPTSLSTTQVTVTAQASAIIPERPERMTVIIRNTGTQTAYLGPNAAVNINSGFPLMAGEILHLDATTGLNAVCASGLSTTLAILDQLRTDQDAD